MAKRQIKHVTTVNGLRVYKQVNPDGDASTETKVAAEDAGDASKVEPMSLTKALQGRTGAPIVGKMKLGGEKK